MKIEEKEKPEDIVIKGLCRVLDNQKEIVEEIDKLHKLIQEIKEKEQNGCGISENENG